MLTTRLLVALLIALCLLSVSGADAAVLISVEANPASIPADGKSYTQILVTVVDGAGLPVPDDTEVRLTTSAGDITPDIYTSGGRAVGILTASAWPQIAQINAIVEGTSGSVQVEFASSDYEEATASARTIRMSGGSLAYSLDEDTILGSNGVSMEYRGLAIHATSAQVCQASGQLRGQGEVVIEKDGHTLTADSFTCDLRGDQIRLLDMGDAPTSQTYDVGKLTAIGSADIHADIDSFAPLLNLDSRTWIVSERLVLIPGQKILFFKASVYVGDAKVLKMPCYSYSYETRDSILSQVRYSSTDGMLVDLPFYYRATDSGTGALKLRYAADGSEIGSYYRPRKGASLGLEQDYSLGERSQGRFFVDSIASPSLAFELTHHVEYGSALNGGRADLSARYQPTSSYGKNMYNTAVNMVGNLRDYSYSLTAYLGGNTYRQQDYLDPEEVYYVDQSTTSIKMMLRPRAPISSSGLGRISPSLTVGYGSLWDSSGGGGTEGMYESLGLSFYQSNSRHRGISTSLDGTVALTATHDGDTGASLRLRPSLRRHWNGGSASLSYTLNLQQGTTDSIASLSRHQLGCSLFLANAAKWGLNSSVNYGLDSKRLNLYSSLYYRVAQDWTVRSSYFMHRYAYSLNDSHYSYETSYFKVGIYRPLGAYEIGIAWSPNGQYYGIDKNKRLWLELGGSGF